MANKMIWILKKIAYKVFAFYVDLQFRSILAKGAKYQKIPGGIETNR